MFVTAEPQLRLFGDERPTLSGKVGEVPAVVINNAILRQHFRHLTTAFLRPFNRYFRVDAEALKKARAGPYDDLMKLVPRFDEKVWSLLGRNLQESPCSLVGACGNR